jgi:hypothetical protein
LKDDAIEKDDVEGAMGYQKKIDAKVNNKRKPKEKEIVNKKTDLKNLTGGQ